MYKKRFSYRADLYLKSKRLRNELTPWERMFWSGILKTQPFGGYTWNRQKPIHIYIADFYCRELKLIIEIDGKQHKKQKEYDEKRTHYLESLGLTIIRFTNDEVNANLEEVRARLLVALCKIHPVPTPWVATQPKSKPLLSQRRGRQHL